MTGGRYLEGLVLLCVAILPIAAAAHAWRRRLLPGWVGPPGWLAEIVVGLAAVVILAELAGIVHLFTLGAIVPIMGVAGAIGWWSGQRGQGERDGKRTASVRRDTRAHEFSLEAGESGPLAMLPRGASIAAIFAVGLLVADWATRTVDALHHGMRTADTLWYHMPFAARFVQQGTIVPLHYVDSESVTVFFPASSELFHALGILFMGNDILSPFVNMGWMAMALLAAWCAGRPFGVAPVTLVGVAMLLVTPGLVATQPGGAYDDVVGLALLLSCAALLLTAAAEADTSRLVAQSAAALGAGTALGVKFTLIAPVVALTVGIAVLARRKRRVPEVGTWLLLVAVSGGFWYLRNLIIVGNPLPSLNLKLGPLALPSPPAVTPSSTLAEFILNGSDWHHFFLPGLRLSFGPAWWAILGLAAAGLLLGIVTRTGRVPTMLSWVGVVTAAAFVVSPQYLANLGVPVYFVDNVRYVDPAVVVGLIMLPLVPFLRTGRRPWWLLGGYLLTIVATQLDGTIWPTSWLGQRFAPPIGGADSLIGLLVGGLVLVVGLVGWAGWRRGWRPNLVLVAPLVVVVLFAGFGLQQFYLEHRYTGAEDGFVGSAKGISHQRIGVAGDFTQLQYWYYGRYLTNFVQYVAKPGPHHGYSPIKSCRVWRDTVNNGHYNYIITATNPAARRGEVFADPSSYTAWTGSDPASVLLRRAIDKVSASYGSPTFYLGFSLFRLNGDLDPETCSGTGPSTGTPT